MTGKIITLKEVQKEQIQKIKEALGLTTDNETIRAALRFTSEGVSK